MENIMLVFSAKRHSLNELLYHNSIEITLRKSNLQHLPKAAGVAANFKSIPFELVRVPNHYLLKNLIHDHIIALFCNMCKFFYYQLQICNKL